MCDCGRTECRECRLRGFGRQRRKYHFTPELTAALREAYRAPSVPELTVRLKRLQRLKPEWPAHAWRAEATRLGISVMKRGPSRWTAEEDKTLLMLLGRFSAHAVAKRLGRTTAAVQARAAKLQFSTAVRAGYTVSTLASAFGVTWRTAQRWTDRGLFGRPRCVSGEMRITETAVREFMRRHHGEYDLRRVDQAWFVGMAFGSIGDFSCRE